jgi:hypothetical protein
MPVWAWVLIAVIVVLVAGFFVWQAAARRRTERLRGQFGPEYDRTIGTADSRRDAEAELVAREERRSQLEIRSLTQAAHDRYVERWQVVQSEFVDDPRAAVSTADTLIQSVMGDCGYPVDDFEQRAADISVDHPLVVENYREGHRLAHAERRSTEDLRQAMQHYRALFDELVEPGAADEPLARDRAADDDAVVDSARSTVR